VAQNAGDITDLTTNVNNGTAGPVQRTGTPGQLVLVAPGGDGITPGAAQKLTNVAAGAVNAASTDAVNGSQLFGVSQSVAGNLGGGSTVNPDGTVTGPTYNVAGNNYTNVYDAVSALNGNLTHYYSVNDGGVAGGNYDNNGAAGAGAIAVGMATAATAADATAIGTGASASIDGSLALGSGSVADRAIAPTSGTIPVGSGTLTYNTSDATLLGAVSLGDATSQSYRQITNLADGTEEHDAVTIRQLAGVARSLTATGTAYFHANSTAGDSLAVGDQSVAVGPTTVVNGDNGIGIGNGAIVQMTAPGGTAIGQAAEVSQADAVAMGTQSKADGVQSVAIGAGANASFSGSVALGAGATTTVGAQTGYTSYGLAAAQTSAGEVSVGSAGAERTITNVAAGSAPTDAVNVSQLDQVAQNSADSLGGGAAYDPVTGAYSGPSYAIGGTTYTNVGDALAAQDRIVGTQGSSIATYLGGGATYDPGTGTLGGGFTVNGNTYANVAAAFNDVAATAGNAVQYDDAGHTSVTLGGAGAGAPVGLHNVAAGDVSAGSTDAVNGSQLAATNDQVAQNTGDIANNTTAITNLGGQVNQNASDIANLGDQVNQNSSDIDNLADGIANGTVGLVQQTGGAPGDGQITIGGSTGGTSVSVAGTDGDRVISGVADGVAANDAVNVSQLAAAITSASQNAVSYDDGSHTSVTFNKGGAAAGLHNVAAGDVSAGSTDAVNGSQLFETNQQVASNTSQINDITSGNAGPFRSNNTSHLAAPSATGDDAVAGGFGAVASGNHSTALGANASATGSNSVALGYGSSDDGRDNVVSVGAAGAERQITNVAAGTEDTDAVNVGQLHQGLADTLAQANSYTDSRLNALDFDIEKTRRDADAGTASALAAAGLPQAFTPGKGMIAGALGVWRGQTAFAFGLSKAFNDGHTVVKGGATYTDRSSTFGANVGVGYQF
jgi:autotransporter adhesin